MPETLIPEGEGWSHGEQVVVDSIVGEQAVPAERWRRFTPPAAIEDSLSDVVVEDGQLSRAADVTWPKEIIEKIRSGYQCLKCWEPQPEPFPVECGNPCCRYPMRAMQVDDFEHEFRGETWVGPTTSLEHEIESLAERSARKTYRTGSSIAVPSDVNRTKGGVILPRGVNVATP